MPKVLPLFFTLRGRLVLLVCLAALPAILFTFYIAHNERNAALHRMEEDARHIVNIISREHLYQMEGAKSLLQWISDSLEKKETEAMVSDSDFLAALLAGHPQLGNIAILAPDGEVINSAYPLPGPINMNDYDAIQRAFHSRDIEVGQYVIGPIIKRPLLHLTHAIRDKDSRNIRWIVFVAIDLEWLKQLTEKVELPIDHILLISDREGRILASSGTSNDGAFSTGREIPDLAGLAQRDQTISARINGKSLSFVAAPMEEIAGVFVASALPMEEIYQKANLVFYQTLGLLGLLTLFTVISVLVVEELALLRAVRALSEASQRFGKGDYTARVAVPQGYGELKDMAEAFNTMAETLTRRHREVTEAHHRLDRLTRHLQVARESEAQRISRDLHDEVGQVLTSIKMDLASFQSKCKHKKTSSDVDCMVKESIANMQHKIDRTVEFIRRLASDLRPPVLDRMGLASAIDLLARNLEEKADLVVEVETSGIPEPLDWLISTTIYRIAQEALTNISRHAQATEVHINLHGEDAYITLMIEDNGKGFDDRDYEKNTLGIIGMRERTRLVGGAFSLKNAAGKGTVMKATIPVKPNEEERDAYHSG